MYRLVRSSLLGILAALPFTMGFSTHQETLLALWRDHCKYEFDPDHKSVEKTMATMVTEEEPYVNHVPTMVGGNGRGGMTNFYQHHFIFENPAMELETVSLTIGDSSLVEEMVISLEHTTRMDWLAPNVPPTGRRIQFPLVAIIQYRQEGEEWKIKSEHIYWDQATVLLQLGVLDGKGLDVTGAEQARKALDQDAEPSNLLLARAQANPGPGSKGSGEPKDPPTGGARREF